MSGTPSHTRASDAHAEHPVERGDGATCEEVCPLCLARYAAHDERICMVCEAPSCPDCAEPIPGTQAMLCYACPVPTRH